MKDVKIFFVEIMQGGGQFTNATVRVSFVAPDMKQRQPQLYELPGHLSRKKMKKSFLIFLSPDMKQRQSNLTELHGRLANFIMKIISRSCTGRAGQR